METKRISDLTILESLSDAANVLVEENGEAKRIPANTLGGASSWNDLTDKPFYEEFSVGEEILPLTELAGEDSDGLYIVNLDASKFTKEPDSVTVSFDGETYNCVSQKQAGNPYAFFGNLSLVDMGSDTREPFALAVLAGTEAQLILPDGETHAVTISVATVTYHKLNPRFVDTHVAFYISSNDYILSSNYIYLYKDAACTTKATKEDVIDAAALGVPILIRASVLSDGFLALEGHLVLTPLYVFPYDDGYASMIILKNGLSTIYVYTAEYTPETT